MSRAAAFLYFLSSTTVTKRLFSSAAAAAAAVIPRQQQAEGLYADGFALVAALKSSAAALDVAAGQRLHAFALKHGLESSNLFARNALLSLYAKCGRLDAVLRLFSSATDRDTTSWNILLGFFVRADRLPDALAVFNEMPHRDTVSFTTMIKGLVRGARPDDALAVFRDMVAAGVLTNEVTLATVTSAVAHLREPRSVRMVHAAAIKYGVVDLVVVATNLVHAYATCSRLDDSRLTFDSMTERNIVTWNVMLNGYAKAGLISHARDLFDRMPQRDLVSWSTMVDGFLRANRLREALETYRGMLQSLGQRQVEVLLVDLVSSCGRCFATQEGLQLHAVIVKTAIDCHAFVQSTLIHFYGACGLIDHAALQFQIGCKSHVPSWNALLFGLTRNNMVDEAAHLFDYMTDRDIVSWSIMIAGLVHSGSSRLALDLFRTMLYKGFEPNEVTLVSVLSAVADCGNVEYGRWIHDYITSRGMPLADNLAAGLIDMYAKRGSITNAMEVFEAVKDLDSVSPWNAIICGLAMHGHAAKSLQTFSDMCGKNIKPNSITFIGVLSACCHNGLVEAGKQYFNAMRKEYKITPTIKHYGCMVDLLARAGCLEEAEGLIKSMPMEADVMIWGSMLAAARTYGNLKIGERAAESLGRLEPTHGAARIMLSNIYADAGRWYDVLQLRKEMDSSRLITTPGCSGIL
ncbi:pentatricopeptide repeat-containing protein At5g19020, mitochondrial-like [Zingiber officinale]|uniref:pentatricopeptide repeat-containing protein At5g19020, mitochondrial-like n=1 Tax=Zingiber officinale TaxID=94328 RepID=UPI001C4D9D49|nr:pentatricopeptide repeat-containing protein At5g19020, mitochondrial-like [Zingiber officinale]